MQGLSYSASDSDSTNISSHPSSDISSHKGSYASPIKYKATNIQSNRVANSSPNRANAAANPCPCAELFASTNTCSTFVPVGYQTDTQTTACNKEGIIVVGSNCKKIHPCT